MSLTKGRKKQYNKGVKQFSRFFPPSVVVVVVIYKKTDFGALRQWILN